MWATPHHNNKKPRLAHYLSRLRGTSNPVKPVSAGKIRRGILIVRTNNAQRRLLIPFSRLPDRSQHSGCMLTLPTESTPQQNFNSSPS